MGYTRDRDVDIPIPSWEMGYTRDRDVDIPTLRRLQAGRAPGPVRWGIVAFVI